MILIVDAMSLYKGTWWDPKEWCYVGTVDYGTGMPEAEDELATEALVFMISSISGHWKHPIAYFLQKKISAEVLTQLIQDCIGLLHAEHLNVLALVLMVHLEIKVQQYNLVVKCQCLIYKPGFHILKMTSKEFM